MKISSQLHTIHLHSSLFTDLAHLRRLFIENCDFTNVQSDSLKSLINLEVLVIKNPINSFHIRLEVLEKLTWLNLILYNYAPIFDNLSNNNLEILILKIIGDFESDLDTETEIGKTEMIKNMKFPNLKAFQLKTKLNKFNLDCLLGAPNLINLDISKCGLRFFNCGDRVTKIEVLNLSKNFLYDWLYGNLSKLVNLRSLDFSRNNMKFQPGMFREFRNLTSLYLRYNHFKQVIPKVFDCLDKLESLSLKGNELESIDKVVFRSLKKLKILDLSCNGLTTLDSDMFAYMSNLVELDLSSNDLFLKKKTFHRLKRLKSINLSQNCVGLTICDKLFSKLSSLEELNLDENKIGKINGRMFKGLDNLKELYLRKNHLEIENDAFSLMKNLENVHLDEKLKDFVQEKKLNGVLPNIILE